LEAGGDEVRNYYKMEPRYHKRRGAKLNLGSGTDIREGFVNLDWVAAPGVLQWNVECDRWRGHVLPFPSGTFSYILMRDILEHIPHRVPDLQGEFFYPLVEDLLRVSRPGCVWEIISPSRPESMGACGHTRLIDTSTFQTWLRHEGWGGRSSLEVAQAQAFPYGYLRVLEVRNGRQWNPRDYLRFGRGVVKRIVFEVIGGGKEDERGGVT